MKHSTAGSVAGGINKILSVLSSGKTAVFSVGCPSLLPFVLSFFNFKKLVVCKDVSFDLIFGSFGLFPESVVGFPHILKEHKQSQVITSFHDELFNRSSSLLSSSPKDVQVCVVDSLSLDVPAVFLSSSSPARVGVRGLSFDALLGYLKAQKYTKIDRVFSPGNFAVRGGVVDVFSFGCALPFRCGFLGSSPSVLFYSPSSGEIIKKASFGVVHPFPKKRKSTVRDFCSDFFLISLSRDGFLSIKPPLVASTMSVNVGVSFSSFSYKKYRGSSFLGPRVYSKNLLTSGCFFQKTLYLPSWFSGKAAPSLGSVPLSGSFSPGDYYVHEAFGVCRYLGLLSEKNQNEKALLEFADGKMSLDVRLLGRLSFFSSSRSTPSLGYLNKPGLWERRKKSSYNKAKDFIAQIIKTYTKREAARGVGYVFDSDLNSLFLSSFPYIDTPDQSLVWKEIIKDLCSVRPMQRLLCGDVGFGKTEIAIRAAFLACINKKGSLVLAPTTILCSQLSRCFSDRLSPFGVSVVAVSRLTKKSSKKIDAFVEGKADVLIGTHSILRYHAALRKASLVIVDDEHRFGVKDKELVLEFSPLCNYLSLSATPIPRSLQLSLTGARNISTLFTPPSSRKPIITNVYFYKKELFINTILSEIERGGQVYVVDNSVKNVRALYSFILGALPGVSVSFLFGSMKKQEVEKTMLGFTSKKFRVLVSTTIVESGIDVPLANTIIINNAHSFGLSQLHQLRGRVGRSGAVSYAYLFVPKRKKLSKNALSRLKTIKINSDLGAGYRLALSDLQTRGSGNLFGYGQSGQGAVGFEYYSKLLSLAIKRITLGEGFFGPADVVLEGALIPPSFIPDASERAFYYKSIFERSSLASLASLKQKTADLFGVLPFPFLLLFNSRKLSLLAENTSLRSISVLGGVFSLLFVPCPTLSSSVFLGRVSSFFSKHDIKYTCSPDGLFLKIQFSYVVEDSYILIHSLIKKLYV